MTSSQTLPEDTGRRFVRGVHETLLGAADALGDLDRRAGDGDFGTRLRAAMRRVGARPGAAVPTSSRRWLTAPHMGWLGAGGTGGPLFGMFLRGLARAAATGDEDAGEGGVPSLSQFAEGLAAG